jgi:hypothetical protein
MSWRDGYRLKIAGVGEARILPDDLGHYTAEMRQGDKQLGSRTVGSIEEAFRLADRAVDRQWGAYADWTKARAKWIKEPASAKQLGFLRRNGVPDEILKDLSKGRGSALIEKLLQKKGGG